MNFKSPPLLSLTLLFVYKLKISPLKQCTAHM